MTSNSIMRKKIRDFYNLRMLKICIASIIMTIVSFGCGGGGGGGGDGSSSGGITISNLICSTDYVLVNSGNGSVNIDFSFDFYDNIFLR